MHSAACRAGLASSASAAGFEQLRVQRLLVGDFRRALPDPGRLLALAVRSISVGQALELLLPLATQQLGALGALRRQVAPQHQLPGQAHRQQLRQGVVSVGR
jgi:hypothetical protein